MAAELSSVRKRKPIGFMAILSSAACEWLLMFLLFVDAVLSYLLRRFAWYCELQTPCPLCSRLDHVFGKKKSGCCWSLVCSNHKEEISSLVYCSTHGKLADVRGMCDECLMPIAMQNKPESCKLLVGKSWVDVEQSVLQNLMVNEHVKLGSSGGRTCSCCNKTWASKSNVERLLELKPVGLGSSNPSGKPPLPRPPCHSRLRRRDSFKRLRGGKFTVPTRSQPTGNISVDTMSHVGYTKLKFSSDSESEFPLSEDDDDANVGSSGNNYTKPENGVGFGRRDIPTTPVNNVVLEKQTHQGSEMKDQRDLLEINELKNVCPSTDDMNEHSLRELSSSESYLKPSRCLMTDPILLNDVPQPTDVGSMGASAETSTFSLPQSSTLSAVSERLSLHTVPSSDTPTIAEKSINIRATCQNVNTSETVHIEAAAGTSSDDTFSSNSNSKNLTDLLSQNTENMELSCEHQVELFHASDMKSTSQVRISEVSLLLKDTSPRPHDEHHESTTDEESSSQSLRLMASLKGIDSSCESLDGINVNDMEGESIVDRLRQQVEHDQNCLKSLYKELEEERDAAAVAANQAMAMITRLQEEKAALQMEARQYLRMMEEKSEYDMTALEIANDLLSEKEKELQDLETELEFYRNNLPDESGLEDLQEETPVLENNAAARSENAPSTSSDSKSAKISEANGECKPLSGSISNFEDEKLYISQCLKKLEDKLHKAYCSGNVEGLPNGLNSYKIKDEFGNLKDSPPDRDTLLNFEKNVSSASNGSPARSYASIGTPADGSEDDCHYEESDSLPNSAAFEKEISALRDRLEALETDRDLLRYASNLLQNGKDGLRLIQDLAHQLQELRKIESRER